MVALASLHADAGITILFGLLIGVPTAIIGGLAFSRVNCGDDSSEALALLPARSAPPNGPPSLFIALFTVLLPVGLMILGACAQFMLPEPGKLTHWLIFTPDSWAVELRHWLLFAGDPVVAMLIAVLLAFYTLGSARGFHRRQILNFCNVSLVDVGGVLLIVGAGGGLSRVLIDSGVDKAVDEMTSRLAVSPLVMAWLMAAVVRVATGSATVAIASAAELVASMAAKNPSIRPEFFVLAMGAGSLVLSHVNDGGFWLVQKYVRMTVPQTLRTWTVLETMVSFAALGFVLLLNSVL
jgi:GntP family gluconate:H+ symporter